MFNFAVSAVIFLSLVFVLPESRLIFFAHLFTDLLRRFIFLPENQKGCPWCQDAKDCGDDHCNQCGEKLKVS